MYKCSLYVKGAQSCACHSLYRHFHSPINLKFIMLSKTYKNKWYSNFDGFILQHNLTFPLRLRQLEWYLVAWGMRERPLCQTITLQRVTLNVHSFNAQQRPFSSLLYCWKKVYRRIKGLLVTLTEWVTKLLINYYYFLATTSKWEINVCSAVSLTKNDNK